uniref:Protein odr-4 homolog n=1 Tax=Bos mutus grunniens TaxID=30521 RepID=A0A8B9XZC1_BOSMU
MGRTYIVEETVGQYLSNINLQGKAFVSGLLIGQCSSQKDYVILATRTPPKEEQNESPTHSKAKLDNLDEEWATEHAHQVSRMLPGGLLVLGVFIITALEMGSEFQNTLRRLVFAVEKSVNTFALLQKKYFVELMIFMIQRVLQNRQIGSIKMDYQLHGFP